MQVGAEPVPVYAKAGVPVAVTFPERVEAIPTGADPAALSLEIEGKRLFIQSLVEGFEARVFVIAAGGRMYQLHLTERQGEPDDQVQLVQPVPPPVFGAETPAEQRAPAGRRGRKRQSPLRRLLVAMIEGTKLPGVSVVDHAQTLLDDGAVAIRTLQVYVAGRYLGYVSAAQNCGTEPVAMRLPEYQAAGLRAIAAAPPPRLRVLRADDKSRPAAQPVPAAQVPERVAAGPWVYLPAGSQVAGTILTGAFATKVRGDGLPVLARLEAAYLAPNDYEVPLQACLMIGKATADLQTIRARVEAVTLSCVLPDGEVFERKVRGYFTGADGTLGIPGTWQHRSGAWLGNLLAAMGTAAGGVYGCPIVITQVATYGTP